MLEEKPIVVTDMVAGLDKMKKMNLLFIFAFILGVIGVFWLAIPRDTKTSFMSQSSDQTIKGLIRKEKGIYVFGFDSCPWCKELYPILDDVLLDNKEQAWVVDTHDKDFSKNNKDNLRQFITDNTTFDGVIVPFIVLISDDGFLQYHVGTLADHDATKHSLTHNQSKYLQEMLDDMISKYKKHNHY